MVPSRTLPGATILAVALEVPEGGLDHRIDLAALALRPAGERYALVGSFHCVLHAGMSAALIAERCRLPSEQVLDRTPVAVALSALDCHLTVPPYLVVTSQAAALSAVIARHAAACPALAAAELADVMALARPALGDGSAASLAAVAAQLGVALAPRTARTAADAALTGAVYLNVQHEGGAAAQSARPVPDIHSAARPSHAAPAPQSGGRNGRVV